MAFSNRLPTLTITGFEGFHGVPHNTSEEVISHIKTHSSVEYPFKIYTHVFPVVYRGTHQRLKEVVQQTHPDILILTGVHQRTDTLFLERTARSQDHSSTPDNEGEVRLHQPILTLTQRTTQRTTSHPPSTSPPVTPNYVSPLPLESFADSLTQSGIPTSVSDDAGGFICNHYYYRACEIMHSSVTTTTIENDEKPRDTQTSNEPHTTATPDNKEKSALGPPKVCLFVHIPNLSETKSHDSHKSLNPSPSHPNSFSVPFIANSLLSLAQLIVSSSSS